MFTIKVTIQLVGYGTVSFIKVVKTISSSSCQVINRYHEKLGSFAASMIVEVSLPPIIRLQNIVANDDQGRRS